MSDFVAAWTIVIGVIAPLATYFINCAHRRRVNVMLLHQTIAEMNRQLSGDRFRSSHWDTPGRPTIPPPRPRRNAPIKTTVIELTGEQVKSQPKAEAKDKVEAIAPPVEQETTRLEPIRIRPASDWQRPLDEAEV